VQCRLDHVCLAVFRFDPADEWPFLLTSIRDEDLARPAAPPGQWWPQSHPGVVGGRDLRAGGTWLAVDPARRAVAAVFTPGGVATGPAGTRSRGELPLLALANRSLDAVDVTGYLPFALLHADAAHVTWWTWSGRDLERADVSSGRHVANIDGLDATERSTRQARWGPRFAAAAPEPFVAHAEMAERWGGWLRLIGSASHSGRADALLRRRTGPFEAYGTRSVALLAIGTGGVVYDVNDQPLEPARWTTVMSPERHDEGHLTRKS